MGPLCNIASYVVAPGASEATLATLPGILYCFSSVMSNLGDVADVGTVLALVRRAKSFHAWVVGSLGSCQPVTPLLSPPPPALRRPARRLFRQPESPPLPRGIVCTQER